MKSEERRMKKQRSAYEWKANSNELEMTDKNNNIDDKIVRGYGEQALRDEAQAILDQIPYLDDNFEKAVDMMYHCQGKIIVTGVGKSGHVGAKIAATLASTGTPAFYINPLDVYHGDLGVMTDKDVVLALSTPHEYSYHFHHRKSRFPAGKILQPSYHRKGKEGGLSAEPRPYQQYYCSIGYG